jgi:hypothetical protein
MTREWIAQLRTKAKEHAEAFLKKLGSAIAWLLPSSSSRAWIPGIMIPAEAGDTFRAGKRYRLTSGHAPIFSLFTFFKQRH